MMKVYYNYEPYESELHNFFMNLYCERYKYHVMWELRSLESDLAECNGIITLCFFQGDTPNHLEYRNIDEGLHHKILQILSAVNLNVWLGPEECDL